MSGDATDALFERRLARTGNGQAGPEMVWLHGWGQTHESLSPLAEGLRGIADHRLIDLPGFGRSKLLFRGADTADYAEFLTTRLPETSAPRILVGHSFGARLAVRMAGRAHSGIAGLVLIAAAGLKRDRTFTWRLRAWTIKTLGRLAGLADKIRGTALKDAWRNRFGSADYRLAGPLRETLVKTVNEDLSAIARQVSCPVLVIYGAEDCETPPSLAAKWQAAMPQAEVHILPGYGHLDILGPGRHQCDNLIRQFIGRLGND